MNTIMISPHNSCPKCFGSGKVGYRRANGVCFRCNGLGILRTRESIEGDAIVQAIRELPAEHYAQPATAEPKTAREISDNWLENIFKA